MKTVYCPVRNERIDGTDCNIICSVADGYYKPHVLPKEIVWNEFQKKKCLACKFHYDIEKVVLKNGMQVVIQIRDGERIFISEDVDPENWNFFEISKENILKLLK